MRKLLIHRSVSILLAIIFLLAAHFPARASGAVHNFRVGSKGLEQTGATQQPADLLPDLQTLPPYDLRLVYDPVSKRLLIRFSNSIWNAGEGDLELKGKPDVSGDRFTVSQTFQDADGKVQEKMVGEFTLHPQHKHWHLEGFSLYEIWSLTVEGNLDIRLASSGKVSYCVMDASLKTPVSSKTVSASPKYVSCESSLQGISAGWMDTYKESVAGQWLEITHLRSGNYALVSTADPQNILKEADDHNNRAITYFQLSAHRILRYGHLLRDIGIFPERIVASE